MITLWNESFDPFFNLALEEYLLKEFPLKEDLFFVWRNKKSVVIGRNQNPYNEVNLVYCRENDIPVLRRISGGGTVYHDLGNVNFTYITNDTSKINDYEVFLRPIVALLNQIGLKVSFVPKSHIYFNDKKISGNAQATHRNRMLHHGTILYDVDITNAQNSLKMKNLTGHHVLSVPATICNIKDRIPVRTNIESFMEYIRDGVLLNNSKDRVLKLDEKDHTRIKEIMNQKFKTFDWNFGVNSSFRVENNWIALQVENGQIIESSITSLLGKKLDYRVIEEALDEAENKTEILESIF